MRRLAFLRGKSCRGKIVLRPACRSVPAGSTSGVEAERVSRTGACTEGHGILQSKRVANGSDGSLVGVAVLIGLGALILFLAAREKAAVAAAQPAIGQTVPASTAHVVVKQAP